MRQLSRRSVVVGGALAACGLVLPAEPNAGTKARPVRVEVDTALGTIEIDVNLARAPITSTDFLKYVDRGLFDGGGFYRTVRPDNDRKPVKIAGIQGGVTDEKTYLPPIALESTNRTGLRHRDGTLSVARLAPATGMAGSFFICVGNQPELDFGGHRNPDGQGFAAFGQVVVGMEVVRAIWSSKTKDLNNGFGDQMIDPPIKILHARRA